MGELLCVVNWQLLGMRFKWDIFELMGFYFLHVENVYLISVGPVTRSEESFVPCSFKKIYTINFMMLYMMTVIKVINEHLMCPECSRCFT